MTKAKLLEAINLLEATLANAANLGNTWLVDHRRDAIQLRRLLAAQNSEIARLGEEAFDNPSHQAQFRNQFAKMRSATALHQASWPVVSIDTKNPEYLASVKSTRDANKQFIAWVRQHLTGP